jgi:hypothetical protein
VINIRNFRDCHRLALAATTDEKDGAGDEGETTTGEGCVDLGRAVCGVGAINAASLGVGPDRCDQEQGGDREECTQGPGK